MVHSLQRSRTRSLTAAAGASALLAAVHCQPQSELESSAESSARKTASADARYEFSSAGVTFDSAWTRRFAVPENPGWQGSDSTYSIPLTGSRRLGSSFSTPSWSLFTAGDTFISSVNPYVWDERDVGDGRYRFPANTISLYDGPGSTADAGTPAHHFKYNAMPSDFLQKSSEQLTIVPNTQSGGVSYKHWPADGAIVNHGFWGYWLLQFWLRVDAGSNIVDIDMTTWTTGAIDAQTSYPYQGAPKPGNPSGSWTLHESFAGKSNVFSPSGSEDTGARTMGHAVLNLATANDCFQSDGYVYIYGVQTVRVEMEPGEYLNLKQGYVARALPHLLIDPTRWEFWAVPEGASEPTFTATSLAEATPLADSNGVVDDLSNELSVFQLPDGHYAMVYTPLDGLAYGRAQVAIRTTTGSSPSPAGPWSEATLVYNEPLPDTGHADLGLPNLEAKGFADDVYVVYGGKAHPQYSYLSGDAQRGELLVSFNVNAQNSATKQAGFSAFKLHGVYRPRFLRIPFERR